MIRPSFLSCAERRELEICVPSQREDHGVARRANAILLLDDGKSCQAIAEHYSHSGCIKLLARLGFEYRKPKGLPYVASAESRPNSLLYTSDC